MKTQVILIGGFCEVIELCLECGFDILGVVDFSDAEAKKYDLSYLGDDKAFLSNAELYRSCKLVISPDIPTLREKIVKRYKHAGFLFAQVISPDAKVSQTATLGEGVLIQSGVLISAQSVIGDFVRVNIGAQIFHESKIGAYTTLAPRATVLGRVDVAEGCYVGAGAIILPNRMIAERATVGAGAVVTKGIAAGVTVVGVPAREMTKKLKV
jgi:sugar O-acyltransferase (sialic acid O-acetyltransferase NeuD family)